MALACAAQCGLVLRRIAGELLVVSRSSRRARARSAVEARFDYTPRKALVALLPCGHDVSAKNSHLGEVIFLNSLPGLLRQFHILCQQWMNARHFLVHPLCDPSNGKVSIRRGTQLAEGKGFTQRAQRLEEVVPKTSFKSPRLSRIHFVQESIENQESCSPRSRTPESYGEVPVATLLVSHWVVCKPFF